MTTGTMERSGLTVDALRAAFEARVLGGGNAAPAWLAESRRTAFERFAAGGWPTTRDEAWHYTRLAALESMAFDLGADGGRLDVAEDAVRAVTPDLPVAGRLVFVDGRYARHLSTALPSGSVQAGSLAQAALAGGQDVRASFDDDLAGGPAEAFARLNLAFWRDGAFVQLGTNTVLEAPLLLLFVATALEAARVSHPRTLVRSLPGSRATVVEAHVALRPGAYLTNAVTDVVLEPGASLEHVTVVQESPRAIHVGRLRVRQARDSRCAACVVTLGGRLVRREAHVTLAAEGARCALDGLALLGGAQHGDVQTVVDHVAPRATSRQLFKSVLDGRARSVFGGRVVVRRGADGTDAHQTNKNLLLAEGVEADSKPQLEIFADDVKCSHGAADGQLADEAIFYLRSRGLGEATARALVAYGFAAEVLAAVRAEPIRAWLGSLLSERLRDGRVEEDAA
jgi:Fe-S cluster assembly protein SufD